MAIQSNAAPVSNLFGGAFGNRSNQNQTEDRPKAQFWLNVGYMQEAVDENGDDASFFVSIAGLGGQNNRSVIGGIPLDSMVDFPLTGSANMQNLRKRQNELRATILAAAEQLQPGESRIVSTDPTTNLSLELRRVAEAVDADSIDTGECPVKLAI